MSGATIAPRSHPADRGCAPAGGMAARRSAYCARSARTLARSTRPTTRIRRKVRRGLNPDVAHPARVQAKRARERRVKGLLALIYPTLALVRVPPATRGQRAVADG